MAHTGRVVLLAFALANVLVAVTAGISIFVSSRYVKDVARRSSQEDERT